MKRQFRVSYLLFLILFTVIASLFQTSKAKAESYPSVFPASINTTVYKGDEIPLVFTYFPEYTNERIDFILYNSDGEKINEISCVKYNTSIFAPNIIINFNTENYDPGEYKIEIVKNFYTMYEWYTAPYNTYSYIEIIQPESTNEISIDNSYQGSKTYFNSKLNDSVVTQDIGVENAVSAWKKISVENVEVPYDIQLSEMYVGDEAEKIAQEENMYNSSGLSNCQWVLTKFEIKNYGTQILDLSDVIESTPYLPTGKEMTLIDKCTFGDLQDCYTELEPGETKEIWFGFYVLRTQGLPFLKLSNGAYIYTSPEKVFRDLSKATISISQPSYEYTGNYIKPVVTVKGTIGGKPVTLTNSKDYKVTYKNNKNTGKATIIVNGIGEYMGEINLNFTIAPKAVKSFAFSGRTASTVSLKWTKDSNVDGYIIEQYKGGKWTVNKTITSNTTVSHKVTGLKPGTNNKIRIKAYKYDGDTKIYSPYTILTVKTLPSTVKGFTFSGRTASTVTLKWTKNTSADGYVIQQYKSGKWATIKTITSKSTVKYKVTGLKPSKTYKFRIRAYKKDGSTKIYGTTYSEKSVKTLPSTVKGFTYKTRTTKTITLKWYKNTSADGYAIQQYKGGKWVTIKTITNKSTVSYKVTGLKESTSYKFRIRAYKKDGSKKLYSASYTNKTVKTLAK